MPNNIEGRGAWGLVNLRRSALAEIRDAALQAHTLCSVGLDPSGLIKVIYKIACDAIGTKYKIKGMTNPVAEDGPDEITKNERPKPEASEICEDCHQVIDRKLRYELCKKQGGAVNCNKCSLPIISGELLEAATSK